MSYESRWNTKHCRYLSVAGSLTSPQRKALGRLFAGLRPRLLVVAAVDADEAGTVLAHRIRDIAKAHRLPFERHSPDPTRANGWNEEHRRQLHELFAAEEARYRTRIESR